MIDTEEGYSEHDGEPYHPTCYHERFGEKCTRCNKVMMEEIVKALEHTYHPECFCCRGCDVPIADSFFELDGYPVCENCQHPSPVPQSVSPDTNEEVPGPLCTATAAYPYEPTVRSDRYWVSIKGWNSMRQLTIIVIRTRLSCH